MNIEKVNSFTLRGAEKRGNIWTWPWAQGSTTHPEQQAMSLGLIAPSRCFGPLQLKKFMSDIFSNFFIKHKAKSQGKNRWGIVSMKVRK